MQNEPQNEKINFKPLHEGVGFHPFSEGLPYAPESKVKPKPDYTRGTGAMSAGAPTFITPPLAKTTRQIQQQQKIHSTIVSHAPLTTQKENTRALGVSKESLSRKRVFAYLLDTLVHLGFWMVINLIATFILHFEFDLSLIENHWMGFLIFFSFSQWFFIAAQEVLFETSIGKSFFKLEFKHPSTRFFAATLFFRSIVFMLGIMSLGLGFYFMPQDKLTKIQFKKS